MQMLTTLKAILKLPRVIKHSIVITADILMYVGQLARFFSASGRIYRHFSSSSLGGVNVNLLIHPVILFIWPLPNCLQACGVAGIAEDRPSHSCLWFIFHFDFYGLWKRRNSQNHWHYSAYSFVAWHHGHASSCTLYSRLRATSQKERASLPKALIYGAGSLGKKLEIALKDNNRVQIIGFLDDDKNLQGNTLNGLRIYDPRQLDSLSQKLEVSSVLMALPKLDMSKRQENSEQY